MAKLAIKGHKTRGKEVIKILEMLGGKDTTNLHGECDNMIYIIDSSYYGEIIYMLYRTDGYVVFTLEEFLEKFPYKVGDKVFAFGNKSTVIDAVWNESINEVVYTIKLDVSKYTTTKLSYQLQPYKEETMEGKVESFEILESHCADEVKIEFDPFKFEIVERDNCYYVVKKKPKFPKTYNECWKILDAGEEEVLFDGATASEEVLLDSFIKLKRCRDAYWKIAGEQLGLGKPWKPDFTNDDEERYGIYTSANKVKKDFYGGGDINTILTFPTEEMRDAFYENFKDWIEQCKELL